METLEILVLISTLLCTLVAGLVYTFAVVVMPGIKKLNDHDFLNAFKVMDGIIQNNQPMFVIVWIGSVLSLLALFALSLSALEGVELFIVVIATALYVFAVQLPTFSINVPLNNKLQSLDLTGLSESGLNQARLDFESTWIKWNTRRTWASVVVAALLIYLSIQL